METFMSKAKPAQEKELTGLDWLHEMTKDYDYKTAIIRESCRQALDQEASKANLDLNTASEQMFRVSPECLNNTQAQQLLIMLCKESAKLRKPVHCHYCVECNGNIPCFEPEGCEETEGECRTCHEGLRGYRSSNTWLHKREEVMR
jgi:hypothetical protein